MDKQQASDEKHRRFHDKESDFLAFVNLWNYLGEQQKALSSNQFRRQCRVDFLNYLRVREWQDIYTQLRQVVKELGIPVNSEPAEYREIHIALLTGLLSHIGMKDAEKQEFTGARNARFSIFPGSGYSKNRRSGPWWPNWWKPAVCGGVLLPVSILNGLSRLLSIC
jgi:ATP-dependent helicase HrpA